MTDKSPITITIAKIANGWLVTVGQFWTPGNTPGSSSAFFAADHAAIMALIQARLGAEGEKA